MPCASMRRGRAAAVLPPGRAVVVHAGTRDGSGAGRRALCLRSLGPKRGTRAVQCDYKSTKASHIVVGTRGSELARRQAQEVVNALKKVERDLGAELLALSTRGDRHKDVKSMASLGQGAFTEDIDEALLSGECDIAVHSMKDYPLDGAAGVEIVACLPRADPTDALVLPSGSAPVQHLRELPPGTRVGTSSDRRRHQLLWANPAVEVVPARGSIQKRLEMLESGETDALIVASAALHRLGLTLEAYKLPVREMIPGGGQGAIGIAIRADDDRMRELVARIDHAATRIAVIAERAFLSPVYRPLTGMGFAAHARVTDSGKVRLIGAVGDSGAVGMYTTEASGPATEEGAVAAGEEAAEQLTELLHGFLDTMEQDYPDFS
ncbi:unnamed protein product [Pedinophyceae sp. YPF-701]|nr:unnamed protein product [Pedinophyceae sp. YPF-701]